MEIRWLQCLCFFLDVRWSQLCHINTTSLPCIICVIKHNKTERIVYIQFFFKQHSLEIFWKLQDRPRIFPKHKPRLVMFVTFWGQLLVLWYNERIIQPIYYCGSERAFLIDRRWLISRSSLLRSCNFFSHLSLHVWVYVKGNNRRAVCVRHVATAFETQKRDNRANKYFDLGFRPWKRRNDPYWIISVIFRAARSLNWPLIALSPNAGSWPSLLK